MSAMLLRQAALDGIREGRISLAFRRWRRPTVRSGGTLLTAGGQLHIRAVAETSVDAIGDAEARKAGYPSREALLADLGNQTGTTLYRIEFGVLAPDPRIALREAAALTPTEIATLRKTLKGYDDRSESGAWTGETLALIAKRPAVRAGDLCGAVGLPLPIFKLNVRKLKALGLTESLEVGYRLSPRGERLLRALGGAGR